MKIEQIKYLLEIDKYHSIATASQILYLGRTTLGNIVKNVEKELGFSIFQRLHDGVKTTPEGEEALSLMREINDIYQEILQLDDSHKAKRDPIRLIASHSVGRALAIPITKIFYQRQSERALDFQLVNGKEVGGMLLQNISKIGLTYFSEANLEIQRSCMEKYDIEIHKVFHDHQYLVVSADHPLAYKDTVSYKEISDLDFAVFPHYAARTSKDYIEKFSINKKYTVYSDFMLIENAIFNNHAATILCGFPIQLLFSEKLKYLKPILLIPSYKQQENSLELCLIHRKASSLQEPEQILLDCLMNYFRQFEAPRFSPEWKQLGQDHALFSD